MQESEISDADIDQLVDELYRLDESTQRLVIDEPRRAAIKSYAHIQACPGSGKTTLVALKLLLLAKRWRDRHSGVCVLTHTNVAKEEILKWLSKHPSGHKLLFYPHFVGTIQEFVNSFLALPYARSRSWNVNVLDAEAYGQMVAKRNWGKAKDLKTGKSNWFTHYILNNKIRLAEFVLTHDNGQLEISHKFRNTLQKYIDISDGRFGEQALLKKRERLCEIGIFQYREMYALAEQALHDNPQFPTLLRSRFPIVLLDEMQDAQKFQDELINQIFVGNECSIQKLGDPDQSIFDGIGGEPPNESYNNATLVPIMESHRFTSDIAHKIKGLSISQLPELKSCRAMPNGGPTNSILLYGNDSITNVLDCFAELVAQLPQSERITVKAIGSIGKEPAENGLTIKSYWSKFDKSASGQSFKPNSLIGAVRYCSQLEAGNVANRCDVVVQAILQLLRHAGLTVTNKSEKQVFHSKATLNKTLRFKKKETEFRQLLAELVMNPIPNAVQWVNVVTGLKAIFELSDDLTEIAQDYLRYDCAETATPYADAMPLNVYRSANGIQIHVSTIHGIKGETHDATLVLETKFGKLFDISSMIDCFIRDDVDRASLKVTKVDFMKRLYVAISRPRNLLCLAIHKDRIPVEKRELLQSQRGWNIIEL